jgi:hypothetical protein
LKDHRLDPVFGDLTRDADGNSVMPVRGHQPLLDVIPGPKYRAVVSYAPRPAPAPPGGAVAPGGDRNDICFEPMVGIANAMHAAHKGLYKDLRSVAPGGSR